MGIVYDTRRKADIITVILVFASSHASRRASHKRSGLTHAAYGGLAHLILAKAGAGQANQAADTS